MTKDEELAVLRRATDQLATLLADVPAEASGDRTPCTEWKVQDLVDHTAAAPTRFAHMLRGEPVDWSAPTLPAGDDPAATFRANADDLISAWRDHSGAAEEAGLDWQCGGLAVHTWDLATALHVSTRSLDPEVAERGCLFMGKSLTPENRAPAFGPQQPVLAGAEAYERIAAFAGRSVQGISD